MTYEEKPNLTQEEKARNQQEISANLDKYILDSRGNFINIVGITTFEENSLIGREAVSNWEEIINKMASMILQNKEDWEVVLDRTGYFIKNRKDERIIYERGFGLDKGYEIIGELGYRQGAWKDYEKEIKLKRESAWFEKKLKGQGVKKQSNRWESNSNNNPPPTSPNTPNQDKPTNYFPAPTDIENQYNSDKDKERVENNPDLSNPEELLKIIITAELLIKEEQFDSEIFSKLLTEKEKNTPIYQIINQEGRGEKAINQLESIRKSQKEVNNNPAKVPDKDQNPPPTGIIIFIAFLLTTITIFGIVVLKSKKKNKWMRKKS